MSSGIQTLGLIPLHQELLIPEPSFSFWVHYRYESHPLVRCVFLPLWSIFLCSVCFTVPIAFCLRCSQFSIFTSVSYMLEILSKNTFIPNSGNYIWFLLRIVSNNKYYHLFLVCFQSSERWVSNFPLILVDTQFSHYCLLNTPCLFVVYSWHLSWNAVLVDPLATSPLFVLFFFFFSFMHLNVYQSYTVVLIQFSSKSSGQTLWCLQLCS